MKQMNEDWENRLTVAKTPQDFLDLPNEIPLSCSMPLGGQGFSTMEQRPILRLLTFVTKTERARAS